MITGELRNRIDKLWEEFWTGGITNPLTVIEQITFLMFCRLLDIAETRNEKLASRSKKAVPRMFSDADQELRWSHFKNLGAEAMLPLVRDRVFKHLRDISLNGAKLGEYLKDAQLLIVKPSLLVSAVNMIDALPLTEADRKGDLYEYLLSKLTTAGINGQFRTPRHIIRFMVEMVEPKPTDVVGDPACGTAGFLVGVATYLNEEVHLARRHSHRRSDWREGVHRRSAGAIPRAHSQRHVSRVRFRYDDAPHRLHEPAATWRGCAGYSLSGHTEQQLSRTFSRAGGQRLRMW